MNKTTPHTKKNNSIRKTNTRNKSFIQQDIICIHSEQMCMKKEKLKVMREKIMFAS
jgi:hypothetical protein